MFPIEIVLIVKIINDLFWLTVYAFVLHSRKDFNSKVMNLEIEKSIIPPDMEKICELEKQIRSCKWRDRLTTIGLIVAAFFSFAVH